MRCALLSFFWYDYPSRFFIFPLVSSKSVRRPFMSGSPIIQLTVLKPSSGVYSKTDYFSTFTAHIMAIIHPNTVQPNNRFNKNTCPKNDFLYAIIEGRK